MLVRIDKKFYDEIANSGDFGDMLETNGEGEFYFRIDKNDPRLINKKKVSNLKVNFVNLMKSMFNGLKHITRDEKITLEEYMRRETPLHPQNDEMYTKYR